MNQAVDLLHAHLQTTLPEPARRWLSEAVSAVERAGDVEAEIGSRMASALRRLGREALGNEAPRCEVAGMPLTLSTWSYGDAGRVILVASAARRRPGQCEALYRSVFRMGDGSERSALVRGLALLPEPEGAHPVALEAGRANDVDLFAALALNNPYPAAHYTEAQFNQLVLKALFLGLDIVEVGGLEARKGLELSRMCCDYIAEREAAGRTLPASIWLAVSPSTHKDGCDRALGYLASADPTHRYYAAWSLRNLEDPGVLAALGARRRYESDPRVRAVLAREGYDKEVQG